MIIGLHGKAECGKDTAAEVLCSQFGFYRIAFADSIRDVITVLFQTTPYELLTTEGKNKPLDHWPQFTGRVLMQLIGQGLRDVVDPDIWIKVAFQKMHRARIDSGQQKFVISDMRYPNELDFFKRNYGENFKTIQIIRPGKDGKIGIVGHSSEAHTLKCDTVVSNVGTIEEFQAKIAEIGKGF